MRKQKRTLLILCVFLAVLLIVWGLANWLPDRLQAEPSETTEIVSVDPVVAVEAAAIKRIRIENERDSFVLGAQVKQQEGLEKLVWVPQDSVEFTYDEAGITAMVNNLTKMLAVREIEVQAADLSRYGLEDPAARLVLILQDNSETAVLIGDSLVAGSSRYVTLEGSGRICAVPNSTVDPLLKSRLDWLDKTAVVPVQYNDLVRFEMSRARDNLQLVVDCAYTGDPENREQPALSFEIVQPVRKSGDSSRLRPLVQQLTGLAVLEFVELAPADLTGYGLDQPAYSFLLATATDQVTVRVGKPAGSDSLYAMSDHMDAVFKVATTSLDSIDAPLLELMDPFVSLYNIGQVEKIEADILETAFTVEISLDEGKTASDESAVFRLDGRNARIFTESRQNLFASFFQRLISITVEGLDLEADPFNTADSTLVFHLKPDAGTSSAAKLIKVEFARRDDYTDYVFINERYTGFYIDRDAAFLSQTDNYEGIIPAYQDMIDAMDRAVDGVLVTGEGSPPDGS